MEHGTRVILKGSDPEVWGTCEGSGFIPGEVKVRWDDDDEVTYIQVTRLADCSAGFSSSGGEDFSDTPEHHEAMAERAIDAALEDDKPLGWERLDAVARICAILEKLPVQEWWPTIRLVNQWASLSHHQEAAE